MINDVRMSDNQNPTYSIFWPVKGETILHVAAKNADLKEIEFLVENGADPCKLDFDLNVPAKWRAKGQIVFDPKNDKITQYLTQACKKKKEKPIEKKKPLQIEKKKPPQKTATPEQFKAAAEKLWDAVKFDIKHGTNINARDDEGRTLLHIAAAQERMDIVQWLIERGANPTLTDKNGKDPAVTSGDLDILDYIESVQKEWKKAHK
ncbi:MAG: ankyrin repeat domain-containing protein [Candidatus Dependentiae bacterium]|nr:ankyrin repeat domain-containing protein [Candidatus Dependentiae bacterium]